MGDQTKKQKRISADIAKEQAKMKASRDAKDASTTSPTKTSSGYQSNSIAGNSPVGRRKMGNVKSSSSLGGGKSGYAAKAGSGIKRMVEACDVNYGCGAE